MIDVLYEELRARPAELVRDLARGVGVDSTDALDARVVRYLQSPRRLRASPHSYSLEDYGLSPQVVTERLEAYLAWAEARLGVRL